MLTVVGLGTLSLVLVALLGALYLTSWAYAAINRDLPSIDQIASRETFKTAQLYDRKGRLLWEFYNPDAGRRTVVALSEISQYLIDAPLASEDPSFYSNPGIEPRGIVRAIYQNLAEQEIVSGASTITQQLVKNVLISEDERYQQTPSRKVREALLAYQLTEKLPKGQILALYLNEIYYGNQAYGIEAAAQTYFGKHARELTLAEASMLAGLPQSPTLYNPLQNPRAAKDRQAYVLEQMVRHGFLTEADARDARQAELVYQPRQQPSLAPQWAAYVRSLIEQKYGTQLLYQGGLKIHTTLDYDLQVKMEEVAKANQPNLAERDANNTAIVVINPKTGEILALVGSMDYSNTEIDGQVNVALAERQPGSTIKPLVYLTSFTKGWAPATPILDEKLSIADDSGRVWEPQNYDKKFHGNVTARNALGNSLNIPAVKSLQFAGVDGVAELARKMGITTWTDDRQLGLAMALGGAEVRPLDLTAAYTVLANNGLRIPPVAITKIVDAGGHTVEQQAVPRGEQVVDPRYAYMVTSVLSDNNARLITFGPNSLLNLPRPGAAKTGTTDNYRDAWTIGYTPNLTIGVWVGNTDGHPMQEVLSSMSAGKVWRESMDTAIDFLQLPAEEFQRPGGLLDAQVCTGTDCVTDLFPVERVPREARVLQGAGPGPTSPVASTPSVPAPVVRPIRAVAPRTAPAARPGAEVATPVAQPAPPPGPPPGPPPAPPVVVPRRTTGPAPQATPLAPPPAPPAAPPAPTDRSQPSITHEPAPPAAKPQQPMPPSAPRASPAPRRR